MAVSIKMYANLPYNLIGNKFGDFGGETTLKCMLATSSYTPAQTTDDYRDDVVTHEITGTGYASSGKIMTTTNPTITGLVTTFDADDVSWASSTLTARYAVIYDYTTGIASTDPLVAYIDFGENKSSESGTFQLTWNASGIFTFTVAS